MKSTKNEFPNPILSVDRDDYIESCSFETVIDYNEIEVTDENIEVPLKYSLKCSGLSALIDNGQAKVVVSVRSSAASYSRLIVIPQSNDSIKLEIPKFDVVRSIEICCSIIACESIHGQLCPGELNELYFSDTVFDIRKGDILATEEPRIIYVDDSELEKPISSIFQISRRENEQDELEIDFSEQKIRVYLSPNLHSLYREFTDLNKVGSLRRYANSVVVFPVLVEAISFMRSCEEATSSEWDMYKEKRWYRAIEKKAEKYHFDFRDPSMHDVSFANKLLGEIASDSMQSFKDTLDLEVNSGETEYIGGED